MEKELPKNWVEAKLKHLGSYINGRAFKPTEWKSEGLPIIRIQNLNNHNAIFNYSDGQFEEKFKVYDGDLLMSWSASLGVYFWQRGDAWLNQHIFKVVNNEILISKGFLFYCLLISIEDFYNKTHGTGIVHITKPVFENHEISLPPLSEQNRIVAKLDSLFVALENIKKSIKKLNIVSEKFTYACLVDSKLEKFYPREKIGQFLEEGKERIGTNWKSHRLIGVSSKQGITDLRIGQKESFEKYKIVRPGDFIYNTMRVNIGSIAIYEGSEDALTSPDYVVFRVSRYLSSQLLLNFLKSEQGLLEIGTNTKGSVRARLYFTALSEVRMPIAPLKIQELAEEFLNVFSSNISTLNNTIGVKLEQLSKSILSKAFKGELSEQLETDGDAKYLLEEIVALKFKGKKK